MDLYRLFRPEKQLLPIIINVPHAGEFIPDEVLRVMQVPVEKCRRDLDLYVDQIWQGAPNLGVTLLCANMNRYVVDLNRAGDDISDKTVEGGVVQHKPGYYGTRGVVWRTTTDGTPVLPGPMKMDDFKHRIATYHTPYHKRLAQEIARIKEEFGFVIMIDGHSMPSKGRSDHPDSGHVRADVVPGNVDGTSCSPAISEIVEAHYTENGYTVAMNNPYKGAWDTRHYSNPRHGQHTIQIELNRRIYMDEETFEIHSGMEKISEVCCNLIPKLGELDLS